MNGLISWIGFQLDNYFVFDQQVRRVITDNDPFELNLDLRLKLHFDTARLEFQLHRALINAFQETITEDIVNLKSRTNDLLSNRL